MQKHYTAYPTDQAFAESAGRTPKHQMTPRQWTIDAWVIYVASDSTQELYLKAVEFLNAVAIEGRICVDHGGKILDEYEACFAGFPTGFPVKWFDRMQRSGRIDFLAENLSEKVKRRLKRLHFHDDDLVYVAVASRSVDKVLVTGDSDYTAEVRTCLRDHAGVKVVDLEDISVSVTTRVTA